MRADCGVLDVGSPSHPAGWILRMRGILAIGDFSRPLPVR